MAHKKNLYHKSRYYRERQKQLQKVFLLQEECWYFWQEDF